jgi:acyl-CoA synthetase (AMP-forming)/AMP-acid ligase II
VRVERFLKDSARRFPDKIALIAGERRVSYRSLAAQSARLAGQLRARGVARGDRVVVMLDNSPETVVAVFAIVQAGAVFSVVNPGTKLDKLAYILNNCSAKALLTEPRLLPVASEAARGAPSVAFTLVAPFDAIAEEQGCDPPAQPGIELDLAMIV